MKFNSRSFTIIGAALFFCTSSQLFAGTFDSLKADEQSDVMGGKQAVHESKDPNYPHAPWPKYEVFQLIKATPEEAAAVFFDTGKHKDYIPNLKKSDTTPTGKGTEDVQYTMELPMMLGTESYLVHDSVKLDQGTYEVGWQGKPNSSFDCSVGSARFEPLGDVTLLTYTSFVDSIRFGSSLPWVKSGVRDQLVLTVGSIVKHIEDEKANSVTLLQDEITALRSAVN